MGSDALPVSEVSPDSALTRSDRRRRGKPADRGPRRARRRAAPGAGRCYANFRTLVTGSMLTKRKGPRGPAARGAGGAATDFPEKSFR
ncbi:hypothetical protein EVAR_30835_1 [Eumeta japonica]|uniref:Uncharacterized protein n=1 Tax=Eumeta variegata TaxID=151549 RepID=A0A4C1XUA2_EUMVA|nr:hypothetical protein EVAR_30835_1 [Eumeta japonica]